MNARAVGRLSEMGHFLRKVSIPQLKSFKKIYTHRPTITSADLLPGDILW